MEIAILAGVGMLAGGILVRHLLETARGTGCPGCGQVFKDDCQSSKVDSNEVCRNNILK